jgi:Domain of unknown function (DUF4258)
VLCVSARRDAGGAQVVPMTLNVGSAECASTARFRRAHCWGKLSTLRCMVRATISRIRRLIRALDYVVSTHAADELEDDHLSILDLENIILTGRIIGHQRDDRTSEVKTVIGGRALDESAAEVVVKVGPTGRLVVITIYRC